MKNGHDVNLIIKNEQEMKILLLFLIKKLKTFDGVANTMKSKLEKKAKLHKDEG